MPKVDRLTAAQVAVIRKLLGQGLRQSLIAHRFGVTETTISHIKTGKTWAQKKPNQ